MSSSYLESYEDNLKVDKEKCIFCGRCADRCILDNIRLKLAPCRQACPMGVNVQGYVQCIKRGKYDQAREIVREKLPFPEIMCMVCHHPCETRCEKGQNGDPIAIRALKRFLFSGGESAPLPEKAPATGKRVAVVGAGPAGLVAAYDLALKGHHVVIHEAGSHIGGMLAEGIPSYRLPQEVLDRELAILPAIGVEIVCNSRIGQGLTLREIMDDNDAVILASGLCQSRHLGLDGENLDGVYAGLPFLRGARQGSGAELKGRVIVCGGGNMAIDAAMTAKRQGADDVLVLTLENEGQLPAFAGEVARARADGVRFRHGVGISAIDGRAGHVCGVKVQPCVSLVDDQGHFAPRCEGPLESLEADALIVAIGLTADPALLEGSGLTLEDVRHADPLTLQCASSKVFAAGDYQSGPSSVIEAMAQGREAAISADRLVQGEHLAFERAYAGPVLTDFAVDHRGESSTPRQQAVTHVCAGKGDYALLEESYSERQAQMEAERCLSCGAPCGHHRTCWFCLPCEVSCPEKALWVEIPYLLR